MDVRMAVIADYVNETNDGKLNVVGIFNRINATKFPATHLELRLVASLAFTVAECGTSRELTVDFIDADGKRVFRVTQPFQVPESTDAQGRTNNVILALRGLPIPHAGFFHFVLLMNELELARIPLEASLLDRAEHA